tara:strand:+ start:1018 stop:1602 length:585 start_codon:yes stop_codon:yes gene_type:complete
MAGIPLTGNIRMQLFARERLDGNYGGGATITGPISMYNLMNGGNTGGGATSGDNYPVINGQCGNVDPTVPGPAGAFSSWRGYYQDWICYYPTGSSHYSGNIPIKTLNRCVTSTTLNYTYWSSTEITNFVTGAGIILNTTILYTTNNQPAQGYAQTPLTNSIAAFGLIIYSDSIGGANTWVQTNASGVVTSITQC